MWVRLDDAYYDHTKVVHAGPLAELLWVRALAWCNRNRSRSTDGVVPTDIVYRLASFCGRLAIDGDSVSPSDLARSLVREGLWVEVQGGYAIHDYTEYQRTLDELEDISAKRSAAGRKGAESRWGSNPDGNEMANAKAADQQAASPADAPVPSPEGFPSSVVVDELETCPQVPDDVWLEFARLKQAHSSTPIRNHARWTQTTIENGKREHGVEAARWWARFEITPSELAAALVDGGAGRSWQPRRQESA
jgi:hypothetical protein